MGVSSIVDSITGKMGLVSEQNVVNHMGVRINPTAQFQQATRLQVQDAECAGWTGHGGAQNWPPWSPDLNPLDYHVWGYMKAMVYEHKANMREELHQQILSTARSINNASVPRRVTSSLVTRVRKCIQADGGHFEQSA